MKSFNDFCELMDHEFTGIEPLVGLYGVRLDHETGVKETFGLQGLKSADYFTTLDSCDVVLEFSDIGRQIKATCKQISDLKASNFPKHETRKVSAGLRESIGKEARDKYINTCVVLSTLKNKFQDEISDVPELFDDCKFIVVYAPFLDDLSSSDIDVIRVFDNMKNNLVTMMPDEVCNKVEVLPLDVFKRCYEPKPPQPTDAQS